MSSYKFTRGDLVLLIFLLLFAFFAERHSDSKRDHVSYETKEQRNIMLDSIKAASQQDTVVQQGGIDPVVLGVIIDQTTQP